MAKIKNLEVTPERIWFQGSIEIEEWQLFKFRAGDEVRIRK